MTDLAVKYLDDVIAIANATSPVILDIYHSSFNVQHKDDLTPVTDADVAADKFIVDALSRLTPDIPILSEESGEIAFDQRKHWQSYWLVDPLDGTREFIKRNGEFTINIALIENGVAILGVIQQPVTGVCYYAARGAGAFKSENGSAPVPLSVRSKPADSLIIAGSRSHWDTSLDAFLEKIGSHELIRLGSSLKSCLVAEGEADIYLKRGPTSEWDTAAAQVIVEEAQGAIVTLDMQPLRYNTKESLLNPHFMVIGDTRFPWRDFL